jgi:hypothetical protein
MRSSAISKLPVITLGTELDPVAVLEALRGGEDADVPAASLAGR